MKTAALILFVGFAWLISSHIVWLSIKTIHTYQAFQKSAQHQIVQLSIQNTEPNFQLIKKQLLNNEREINLKNKMFDVKYFNIFDKKISLKGWFDTKDDILNRVLHQLFDSKKQSENNNKNASEFWHFEGIISLKNQVISQILYFPKRIFNLFIINKLMTEKIEYKSPPPEF